ncbi:hypothetical protein BDA96_10G098800 [Sorghum bicolor]|uniref:Uncharacterized protein n=2 Tax=Sorghum bicolor TaxID=4558 RepID=A0A921U085_SORBI|nr:hypothetical protein BDA96_10G098800 [Sorghum bicolor]KXG19585.1 hypothetical protein SORBI_3010G081500 [Sorghum bicolor]
MTPPPTRTRLRAAEVAHLLRREWKRWCRLRLGDAPSATIGWRCARAAVPSTSHRGHACAGAVVGAYACPREHAHRRVCLLRHPLRRDEDREGGARDLGGVLGCVVILHVGMRIATAVGEVDSSVASSTARSSSALGRSPAFASLLERDKL